MDYKLNKVKRGTFFNHNIELKFYSADNDKTAIKEFVKLYVDEKEVFKGDLDILLNGNIKPSVFKKYMLYLTNIPDVVIPENVIVKENTNNIDWYKDPVTDYKLVSDISFRVISERPIRISYFIGNSSKYNKYIISRVDTGEIIERYHHLDSVIYFIRNNVILSIREFINCINTFKLWEKLEYNKFLPVNITDCIKVPHDSLEKLDKWLYIIPNSVKDARYTADRKINNNTMLSFTNGNYNGKLHRYKKLGEKEEVYEELRSVRTCGYNSSTSFILLNIKENKLYVTIPHNTLKDQFGIIFNNNDKEFIFTGGGNIQYNKIFDVLYDEEAKWAYVCLSLNTVFTDENILNLLPYGMIDYINENFGEFLNDIFIKYEDFKELEEEYTKVATSLDKKTISDFLGIYDSTGSITDEDDLILDEYIKIKKVLLNE